MPQPPRTKRNRSSICSSFYSNNNDNNNINDNNNNKNDLRVELGEERLTVGKIYAGLLIAENWKAFKTAEKTAKSKGMVRRIRLLFRRLHLQDKKTSTKSIVVPFHQTRSIMFRKVLELFPQT